MTKPAAGPGPTGCGRTCTWLRAVCSWRPCRREAGGRRWPGRVWGGEATGHVLWREGGRAAGVGASGLAGSTVVYGELWAFTGKRGLRGGVGATGYLGDLLWTVELARAGFPMADGPGGAS